MRHIYIPIILMTLLVITGCKTRVPIPSVEVSGVSNPVISLNGSWKFSMDAPSDFWLNEIEFTEWEDIMVPGECQMQGFAIKHDQPFVYKKSFQVPDDYKDKQISVVFYGVYSYARVWVNGKMIRDHSGGFTRWECDITEVVTPGETAILTLEVTDRIDEISYASGYAKHMIGGILRDVELRALPSQNFKQLYFETDLIDNYSNAVLKVFYEMENPAPANVRVELFDPHDKLIVSSEGSSESGFMEIPVRNPALWDAEHPILYTAVTTLIQDGTDLMKTSEKIGFREVRVDGNKLLVNGMPVKLRGACRHDIHPTLGRMTTPELDLKDVLLAKECNINFIRTSHYPPSEVFLDYCDQYGIYVEDETAVCFVGTHRRMDYRSLGATQSDTSFRSKYLSQLEEMVTHHRNHPGIIIWSIGNENQFGSNFADSYKWVKAQDQTRPVIYSYPGLVPDSLINYDIISMHYPGWSGDKIQYGIETEGFESKDMPVLFDEWAHVACYNLGELKYDPNVRTFWGQSLDSMWTYLFETEGGLGGAIWGMIDETFMLPEDMEGFDEWWGINEKNSLTSGYNRPVVGYGEWGIVDTWRRKKPEFWATWKAYSPTKIYNRQINSFEPGEELQVPVHNRFDHTNFSELKITWEYGNQNGTLNHMDLEPHQKGNLIFPACDWNKKEKLNIRFFQNDTLLVDEYNIRFGENESLLPNPSEGKIIVQVSEDKIKIEGEAYAAELNKKKGLLENITVNNETILKSGPYINLRFHGNQPAQPLHDFEENWQLENIEYIANQGIVQCRIEGKTEDLSVEYDIRFDAHGVFTIEYRVEGIPGETFIQEAGLKFIAGDKFEKLTWERDAYFSAYSLSDPGRPSGSVDLDIDQIMEYRQEPAKNREMDAQNFYLYGPDIVLPYTNVVRSKKEHIYYYALEASASKIEIFSDGSQACRFDKINGNNTLFITEIWDYPALNWGNYYKRIKSDDGILTGKVVFKAGV